MYAGDVKRVRLQTSISYRLNSDHLRISVSVLSLRTFQIGQLLFQSLVLFFEVLPLAPDLSSAHVNGCLTQSIEKKRAIIYHEVYGEEKLTLRLAATRDE